MDFDWFSIKPPRQQLGTAGLVLPSARGTSAPEAGDPPGSLTIKCKKDKTSEGNQAMNASTMSGVIDLATVFSP